nr:unnamed protein product [Naegleria fowleri]
MTRVYPQPAITSTPSSTSVQTPLKGTGSTFEIRRIEHSQEEDTTDQAPSVTASSTTASEPWSENSLSSSLFKSIKFCLIMLISTLIVVSVVLLSATWLSTFGPTLVSLSNEDRDYEARNIIGFVEQTIQQIAASSRDIQQQLIGDDLDIYNGPVVEKKMYSAYKSGQKNSGGVAISSYIGDELNYCFGIISWTNETAALFNITRENQKIYYCDSPLSTHKECNRNQRPDEVAGSFDLSNLISLCNQYPGEQVFSESYADPAMGMYTFISLVNCVPKLNNDSSNHRNSNFTFYYGNDMTTGSISKFLKDSAEEMGGHARSFIIETSTEFLIALDNFADVKLTEWNPKDGSLIRKTFNNVDDSEIIYFSKTALTSLSLNHFSQLECNVLTTTKDSQYFIIVYRLCVMHLDWTIVLTVPQWAYMKPIAIVVIVAVGVSIVIVVLGIILAVIFSLKISSPIYNLIELFESVANMDLDNLDISPSNFFEIRALQKQFSSMIKRMKLYRSFIPSHLLADVEKCLQDNVERPPIANSSSSQNNVIEKQSSNRVFSIISSGKQSSFGKKNSKKKIQFSKEANHKFSLYLEIKYVTMVQLLLDGLNGWIHTITPNETVSLLSDVCDQVNSVSRAAGANQISPLEYESLILAFNATSGQPNHEEKAASFCNLLLEKLLNLKTAKWKSRESVQRRPELLNMMSFRFAILATECYLGNVGTSNSKVFTLLSSGKTNLNTMTTVAKNLEIPIVCSENVRHACLNLFQTRYVDTKNFIEDTHISYQQPNTQEFEASRPHPNPEQPTSIYQLGLSLQSSEDEWMYELADAEKKDEWNMYNMACSLFMENNTSQALHLFEQYLKINPNDKPTQQMIQLCKKSINSNKTY